MTSKPLFIAVPAALLVLANGAANAKTVEEAGAIACVTDKWDEKEPEKITSWSTMPADASSSPAMPPSRSLPRTA